MDSTDLYRHEVYTERSQAFPDSSVGKESAGNAGDPGSIPGSGSSLEKG